MTRGTGQGRLTITVPPPPHYTLDTLHTTYNIYTATQVHTALLDTVTGGGAEGSGANIPGAVVTGAIRVREAFILHNQEM